MRVLHVEDDSAMARPVEVMLRGEGWEIDSVEYGGEGIRRAQAEAYDLIICDLQMPDMSGFEVIKRLRAAKVHTPVLVLSGNAIVETKVKALGLGADDYMTKPFHKEELVARARAIVRRSQGHAHRMVVIGKLVINLDLRIVEIDGTNLHATEKEYQVLELLSRHKGSPVTERMFLDALYGGMDEPKPKVYDVFVCRLRKKFAAAPSGVDYIETVTGVGYRLRDARAEPVEAALVAAQ